MVPKSEKIRFGGNSSFFYVIQFLALYGIVGGFRTASGALYLYIGT